MASIRLTTEFKDFLRLLISNDVRFLVVGGYAVSYHGFPRATIDIDIWLERTEENAAKVLSAVDHFGFGSCGLTATDLLLPGKIIRFGQPPNRIGLLTSIDGVELEAAHQERVEDEIDGLRVPIISLSDLRTNKRASGRNKDLYDLENLAE